MKTVEIVTENGSAKVTITAQLDESLVQIFKIKGHNLTPENFEEMIVKLIGVALEAEGQIFQLKKDSKINPISP